MSGVFGAAGGGGTCPCGVGAAYDSCCGPLHRGEAHARTAEQLMRSRYTAYARGDERYLLATWHPSTRPAAIDADPSLRWHALEVLACHAGAEGDTAGTVEFRAHFRQGSGGGQLHEVSRFTRRAGRWVYVDGQLT